MTIEDSWLELKSQLLGHIKRMDDFVSWVANSRDEIQRAAKTIAGAPPDATPPAPTPTPTQPPAVQPTPAPIPAPAPSPPTFPIYWMEGNVPAAAWPIIDAAAKTCGMVPEALAAIEVHESAWYTSKLFKEGHNPGGMKWYQHLFEAFGFTVTQYTAADGLEYTAFASWQDGITAHGSFLTQARYNAIRATTDPIQQLQSISDAGYAEGSTDWITSTTALYYKIKALRSSAPTTADWRPSPHFSRAEVEVTTHGPNALPNELQGNATWLAANVLEPIRTALNGPLKIASWYRCAAVNTAVGGEPDSQHLMGLAADLAGGRTQALWSAIAASVLKNPQVRVLVEGDHYHLARIRPAETKDVAGGQWLAGTDPLPFEVISS